VANNLAPLARIGRAILDGVEVSVHVLVSVLSQIKHVGFEPASKPFNQCIPIRNSNRFADSFSERNRPFDSTVTYALESAVCASQSLTLVTLLPVIKFAFSAPPNTVKSNRIEVRFSESERSTFKTHDPRVTSLGLFVNDFATASYDIATSSSRNRAMQNTTQRREKKPGPRERERCERFYKVV